MIFGQRTDGAGKGKPVSQRLLYAEKVCIDFPGVRYTASWFLEGPAAVQGTDEEKLAVFSAVFGMR